MGLICVILATALSFLAAAATLADSHRTTLAADCIEPEEPKVPDGKKATRDDIIVAQQSVRAFVAKGEAFIECLTHMEKDWGDEATEEQRKDLVSRHNRMVEAMERVAGEFNSAVRAYKAQSQ